MTRNAILFGIQEAINEAKYLILNMDDDEALSTALEPVLELLQQAEEQAEELGDNLDELLSEYEE